MRPISLSRPAFLTALGCAALVRPAAAQSAAVRVGAVPVDGFAEAYYAQEMGFFRKNGLNVEITTFNNGSGTTQAVAGGAIDIGISTVTAVANAALHGIPYVYIAGGSLYVSSAPSAVLTVAKDSPVRGAADLVGKTVAISAFRDGTHLAMAAWLTRNNVDPAKVSFVEMPYPTMGPAVQRGTVAAAVIVEPFIAATSDIVRVFAKPLDALAPEFLLSGWFTTDAWLKANRESARTFVRTIYETARWANENHAKSAEILQKHAKVDDATMQRMARAVYADSLTAAQLDPTLEWSARVKFIERRLPSSALIATV